jgi:glycosyltransferase involved in cell wall biosynthesis
MNNRIPETPPVIKACEPGVKRPLWSVMIPTYNCIGYLTAALTSVLAQDQGADRMQIEVIDDASTDGNIQGLVEELGKGRVVFYQQPENRGSLRNFETCINRSRGEYIHLLHGDDFVEEGFYTKIEQLYTQFPGAGMAFTGFWYVDGNGKQLYSNSKISDQTGVIKNWLSTIAEGQKIQTPAVVIKRSVFESVGGYFAVHYGEDWEMYVRIAEKFPVVFSPERLASYRIHDNNLTSRYFLTGQHIRDIIKVMDIIQAYLPEDKRAILKTKVPEVLVEILCENK